MTYWMGHAGDLPDPTCHDERRLTVRFSEEAGVDDGGPTREFMRLALKARRESPIFEGPDAAKMLAVNIACKYFYLYYIPL